MLGAPNPLPFRVGGGPTPTSTAYKTIRQAVGKGGSAENDLGIDGLWRRSRAKGLAAATSSTRRALMQAFPFLATDALPYYERRLGLVAGPNESDPARRAAVVAGWTTVPVRSWNDLAAALQALDPRFSLVLPSDSIEAISDLGRAFDAYDPTNATLGPAMGIAGGCTQYPNFSTRQVLRVSFPAAYVSIGQLDPKDLNLMTQARQLLRSVLPSDQDFQISIGVWTLDTTPIGYGELA